METGALYICATPIGNLEDASFRLISTLQQADVIACEDTRQTLKLLNHFNIKKPLMSYHENSTLQREEAIIDKVVQGQLVALVSDAGMPGISDPGQKLVSKAREKGLKVVVIPGPSAVTAALVATGFDCDTFIFAGFLARKSGKRKEELFSFISEPRTVVIYESPHRLEKTLLDIVEVLGPEREIAIARELTKIHEEVIRGKSEELLRHFQEIEPRGEICIVISGSKAVENVSIDQVLEEVKQLIDEGMEKKRAFKIKAQEYKISKSLIYRSYIFEEKY